PLGERSEGRKKEVRSASPDQAAREHARAETAVPGAHRHPGDEDLRQQIRSQGVPDRQREHEREPAGEERQPIAREPPECAAGSGDARGLILGMSDGLTTPFALAAGLAGATTSNLLVVTGGLAEIAAGSISMGLGGYLAAQSDAETYRTELAREVHETKIMPR